MMSANQQREAKRRASLPSLTVATLIGTTIEWYDYFIYGAAAALVFPELFFPNYSDVVGLLASFATFGAGFVARPLGGVIFGHFGDRVGRKSMLVVTLTMMGVATTLIGLLPTYSGIGVLAPALLVALRLIQGLGVGGEWGGAAVVIVEYAPKRRRGLYGSLPQVGNALGLLLSSGVFALFALLPEEAFLSWGWRVPFLLSLLLVGIGVVIRSMVAETPVFESAKTETPAYRLPIVEVFRSHHRTVIATVCLKLSEGIYGYVIITFVLSYITGSLGMPRQVGLVGTTLAAASAVLAWPLLGGLSDRVGRKPVLIAGGAVLACMAFPFFGLLDLRSAPLIWLVLIFTFAIGNGLSYSVQPALFCELFSTHIRYSGISICYQVALIIGGGFAPFVATFLLDATHGSTWSVSLYLLAASLLSLTAAFTLKETFQANLTGERSVPHFDPRSTRARPANGR